MEKQSFEKEGDNLVEVVKGFLRSIFSPEPLSDLAGTSIFHRTKTSLRRDFPRFLDSSRSSVLRTLRWARNGSPLHALLVLAVGAITLLTLTGLLVFMLFFLTATLNAVVISLLVSLAAAGGFLAIFFTCLAAIYLGALSVALFVISTATILAIGAVLITSGWIAFLLIIWLGIKKSADLAKRSISFTGSTVSAFSAHSHRRSNHREEFGSDQRKHNHHHE